MGGKTSTSTSGVTIPPSVLAQYQSVMNRANKTANTPFQQYGGQFVAPVNQEQITGAETINANAAPISASDIQGYESPYLQDVLGSTESLINQQNQQAQAGQLGSAISSGAFGGDRTGIAAANLNQQEITAEAPIYAGIANQGYNTALSTAETEQGIGLQGGEAEIGAGSVAQQTAQAKDTAEYNQFLQQQSYPFQVDQFLGNLAEATGALSGSTTTTQQPGGFFSDRRLKHDIKKVGKTYDGQTIYSYKLHGDDRTHIGLIAQDVEKMHPRAVGLAAGYKTVDYDKATEKSARKGRFAVGGVAGRGVYADGGAASVVSPNDLSAILAAQANMYAPMAANTGVYGGVAGSVPRGGSSRVPAPSGATPHLVTAGGLGARPTPAQNMKTVADTAKEFSDLAPLASKAYSGAKHLFNGSGTPSIPAAAPAPTDSGPVNFDGSTSPDQTTTTTTPGGLSPDAQARGGRVGLAQGGLPYSDPTGTMDIPDVTPDAKLQPAPQLEKQATGLQNLEGLAGLGAAGMQLGNGIGSLFGGSGIINGAVDAAGMLPFSRGGVAGRRGYDDGGDVPDQPDPVTGGPLLWPEGSDERIAQDARLSAPAYDQGPPRELARVQDVAPAPTGVAPSAAPVSTGVSPAAPASSDTAVATKTLWDKIKGGPLGKTENLVPLLTAIGAMGTAPTRSLGVALAAGVGAGAQSYYPAQEAEQEVQAQTIKNKMANLQYGITADALHNPGGLAGSLGLTQSPKSGAAATAPSTPSSGTNWDAYYRNKLYVPPITPTELAAKQKANALGVSPMLAAPAKNTVETAIASRVAADTSANQNQAQQESNEAYQLATTSGDPKVAADQAARYNALHQWTGDKWVDTGGVVVNSRTGDRPVGSAAQVIPPSTLASLVNSSQELVSVPQSDGSSKQMTRMAAVGATSPSDYANKIWKASMVTPGASATIPQQQSVPRSGPPSTSASTAPSSASTPRAGTPSSAPILPGVDIGAFPKAPPTASGRTASAPEQSSLALRGKMSDEATDTQAEASRNNALLTTLQSKLGRVNPRDVGPASKPYKALMDLQTTVTANAPDDLVDMGVLDKFASQLGIQNVRGLLAHQRITNQEMMTFMERASSSVTQPLDVMKAIVSWTKANNDYDLLAANTTNAALANGADPKQLPGALENASHRSDFVRDAMYKDSGVTPVKSRAEAMKLSPGTKFGTPDGRVLVR